MIRSNCLAAKSPDGYTTEETAEHSYRVDPELKRSINALVQSMPPSPLIRVPGTLLAHVSVAAVLVLSRVFGVNDGVERLRAGLNDKRLFPAEAPRLYIYSKADEMVWWEDVEEHAKAAEDLGWKVERASFEGSAHVGHMLEDGERYWDAVKRTWGMVMVREERG